MSESELNARYIKAAYRFASASGWKEYLNLADEFRALDTYKDSAQKYSQCVKAASAPAYREVQAHLDSLEVKTAQDYREAARIMGLIQDYQDARELMRVYTVKAQVMTYDEAMALLSNSEATCEDLGRGVDLLKSIKSFRNARTLIERFERYYFERMYAEGLKLMQNGHVYSEFDEAADIFEKIAAYSDAAEQAAACRKKANKMRPRKKREPAASEKGTSEESVRLTPKQIRAQSKMRGKERAFGGDSAPVRPNARPKDETVSGVAEVWHTLDKRRLAVCVVWLILLIACVYVSTLIGSSQNPWIISHANSLRIVIIVLAAVCLFFLVRNVLWMLTASMRKKLSKATLAFMVKLFSPVVHAVIKLLQSIGIDLSRRNRLGGWDEKSFIYDEDPKEKRKKKKLKNDLKWVEQQDNVARVRFIFIEYMIRRIREGYFMRRTMTPAEISRDMALENDEKELLRVYQIARYAGRDAANDEITDNIVDELWAVNQKKN